MSAIIGFLTSKIAGPIASAAAVVFLVLLVSSRCAVADLEDDLRDERAAHAMTTANLSICHGNVTSLEGVLETQNAAVAALEAERDDAKARAEDAARRAAVANARANRSAGEVLALRPVGEVCGAALDLIREPSR